MVNFGDLPVDFCNVDNARIIILPIPFDGTSTWVKGADKGPAALLEASANMELYDIETDTEVYKAGIHTATSIKERKSPERMVAAVRSKTDHFLNNGKFVVALGGEHSVSIGTIQAHAAKYPNLSVIQIDAHADLRDSYEGSKNNHACVMARAKELCPIVQVGIRSMDSGEITHMDLSRVFWAHNIGDDTSWEDKALGLLTEDVYLTIDLDGFDPSILPSTGTPEPGGLEWYPTLRFLKKLIDTKNLVGFDVVELCPNKLERSSDFLAAKLVYKILSYKFGHMVKK